MTLLSCISLFAVMLALAAIPSASVALVVSRSASLGVANGIAVSVGIVMGDLVFVALAVLGMSYIAETFGTYFTIIRYACGAYLIWIGIGLLRSRVSVKVVTPEIYISTLAKNVAAGFLLTLGDVKAILFYASLLPVFIDLSQVNRMGLAMVCIITIVAVGGVKIGYALAARRIAGRIAEGRGRQLTKTVGGVFMLMAGGFLIARG